MERESSKSRTKFWATFSEFKVYIFLVESLIIFVDHFLKNKNRYIYEEKMCEEFSSAHALTLIFIRKIFILQTVFSPPPIIFSSFGSETNVLCTNVLL